MSGDRCGLEARGSARSDVSCESSLAGPVAARELLSIAKTVRHLERALELVAKAPESENRAREELRLHMVLGAPLIAARGYAHPDVRRVFERIRDLCGQLGDSAVLFDGMEAYSEYALANALAVEAYESGCLLLQLARQIPPPSRLPIAHQQMGRAYVLRGDLERAQRHFDAAVENGGDTGLAAGNGNEGRSDLTTPGLPSPPACRCSGDSGNSTPRAQWIRATPRSTSGVMPSVLEAIQVAKRSDVGSRYEAFVSDQWNAPVFPSGGVTTAVALRAMEAELGMPELRLRTFSTMFVSTVAGGRMLIDVEKIRMGRRMSHLRATVRNEVEGAGHVVTAAFGESRDGFDFTYSTMPAVPMPEDCGRMPDPPPGALRWRSSFFDNIELRRVRSFASFETGWEAGSAEALRWMRYQEPPRLADGRIDPLSLVGLADTMPPAVSQYLGPGYPLFHAPSVDLTMRFFADSTEEWVLVKALCHHAGDGYASAEVSIWDRTGTLLANGTQLMLLRFPDPRDLGMS